MIKIRCLVALHLLAGAHFMFERNIAYPKHGTDGQHLALIDALIVDVSAVG